MNSFLVIMKFVELTNRSGTFGSCMQEALLLAPPPTANRNTAAFQRPDLFLQNGDFSNSQALRNLATGAK